MITIKEPTAPPDGGRALAPCKDDDQDGYELAHKGIRGGGI